VFYIDFAPAWTGTAAGARAVSRNRTDTSLSRPGILSPTHSFSKCPICFYLQVLTLFGSVVLSGRVLRRAVGQSLGRENLDAVKPGDGICFLVTCSSLFRCVILNSISCLFDA
jgi:hypothetical protein